LLLALTTAALAHASLERSEPAVGQTVTSAPSEVRLWFTQKLEPSFSKVSVTDASGARVDTGSPDISGAEITVSLRTLLPGAYQVKWHAVSPDTHAKDGSFTFTIAH
jgi:hypothetical protein